MEEINVENPSNNSEIIVQRNEKGQLLRGSILNPKGKTLGSKNFSTDFDEVVEDLAKSEGKTKSEVRKDLLKIAYQLAKTGDFNFYKDIVDRYYGKPKTSLEIDDLRVDETKEKLKELLDKLNESKE
jgi:hypothetical protein